VGDEIVSNPGTVAVGFIGSTRTGRRSPSAPRASAAARDGRQRPLVVLDGADVDAAVEAA
jgi:acyl-CoA reductase-like NAD-dependent aldehyde dehydrogenase